MKRVILTVVILSHYTRVTGRRHTMTIARSRTLQRKFQRSAKN